MRDRLRPSYAERVDSVRGPQPVAGRRLALCSEGELSKGAAASEVGGPHGAPEGDNPMSTNLTILETPARRVGAERRGTSRITYPFPLLIRWAGADGRESAFNTVLDNMSATGLYFRLVGEVRVGAEVECAVSLGSAAAREEPAPSIHLKGVVVRAEGRQPGVCGVGVAITRHRFA